jgi:hypothetical protein
MRRATIGLIALLVIISGSLPMDRSAHAGSVQLYAGSCLGAGGSYASPGAQSYTRHESGYSSVCVSYYHSCSFSYVYGGQTYYDYCSTGWFGQSQFYWLPANTTGVASTHNICSSQDCSGYWGTNSWS